MKTYSIKVADLLKMIHGDNYDKAIRDCYLSIQLINFLSKHCEGRWDHTGKSARIGHFEMPSNITFDLESDYNLIRLMYTI